MVKSIDLTGNRNSSKKQSKSKGKYKSIEMALRIYTPKMKTIDFSNQEQKETRNLYVERYPEVVSEECIC